jgi:hypothetical protein
MKLSELIVTEMAAESFAKVRTVFHSNFSRRKLELELPGHTQERSVDGKRGQDVTEEYMIRALERLLKCYDQKLSPLMSAIEQVTKSHSVEVTFRYPTDDTFVNFPTVIKQVSSGKYRFVIKTIMIKRDFKTHPGDIVINL